MPDILHRLALQDSCVPRLRLDKRLWAEAKIVAGVDEVGKGCLAGPVYAAAVVLDFKAFGRLPASRKILIRDSKTLSRSQRARILPDIEQISCHFAVAAADVDEIERFGIQGATYLAMRRAIAALGVTLDMVLVDGKHRIKEYSGLQLPIIGGDNLCPSIAAASILAKEARDSYMGAQEKIFAGYGFDKHVGYGTSSHIEQIERIGICPLHRRNFQPISKYLSAMADR